MRVEPCAPARQSGESGRPARCLGNEERSGLNNVFAGTPEKPVTHKENDALRFRVRGGNLTFCFLLSLRVCIFVSSKAGCSKRIAYFCTCRQTLRSGQLLMRLEEYFVRVSQRSTNWTRLYCSMVRATEITLPRDARMRKYAKQM